jgi:hypothetical protein
LFVLVLALVLATAACGFPRPPDVKNQAVPVGGTVHGIWTGADGVALRLTADGVDTLYSVPANGSFSFPTTLAEGASYVVAIASNPARHTCVIASGSNGLVPADRVTSIDVACRGPAVSITLSAPAPWVFDPTQDLQPPLNASVILQEVMLTVSNSDGLVRSVLIAGVAVTLGRASAPQPLALGANTLHVDLAAEGGLSKTYQIVIDRGAGVIEQSAYGKASNTGANAYFGHAVAISTDTMVVGAYGDASGSGAVYVFQRTGVTWAQQAYLKASNADPNDRFGGSVALSGDTLVVGAIGERSNATGINGNQLDNSTASAGAVYVFQRTGTTWAQQAYIKSSNTAFNGAFGRSVALSQDSLAVGADGEGIVYVFRRSGSTWEQQANITASRPVTDAPSFGLAVSLSGDTLAVGDPYQDAASYAGAVYIFQRTGTTWAQQAYLRAQVTGINDYFGAAVALAGDTLVVGAAGEDSSVTGIDGNQADDRADSAGAAYVFHRTGTAWAQQTYVKASNTGANDGFGISVALSGDILAVGAFREDSSATGANGDQANDSASYSGAVYVFQRNGPAWAQQSYIKASNTGAGDQFGGAVALSGDTLAAGATYEASGATGIDGSQAENGVIGAGAAYVFR